ncbi:type II toxin-antitoxin system VapC family toxin [Stenomitos frigidus]|uniref:Nucleic acid-binding protein n=1 Tax=Stenomitos frigidus ULC18 TaxID=2107698 RepID=A0A2T1DVV6_9CYAN|nr:PIN domain-containing protein [Stenomitos frigidus]PSB24620.1 nucleic acid-binding protein [Stenomitos frigidus ULC18]
MRTIFADAGYWIALVNPADDLHHHAAVVSASLAPLKLVTSEMVLTEVLNSFSRKGLGLRKTTVALMQDIRTDSAIEVVPQTSELFNNALTFYEERLDQAWSHTDCASFLTMQQQKLLEALTHDKHFEQAGFIALLR